MLGVPLSRRGEKTENGTDEKRWREVIPFELLAQSCANFKSCVIQQLHTRHKDHLRGAREKYYKKQRRPYLKEKRKCPDSLVEGSEFQSDVEYKAQVEFNSPLWVHSRIQAL